MSDYKLRFIPKKRDGLYYIYDNATNCYVAKKDKRGVLRPIKFKCSTKAVEMIVKLEESTNKI